MWRARQSRGRVVAGGSTISHQLAKNLFLSRARTPWRKGEEALITLMLEAPVSHLVRDPGDRELGITSEKLVSGDLFGLENSYYPYNPSFDMPNDGGRMAHILALIEAGFGDRLLLSHDIAYKTSLVKYGGYGYHHLLVNVVPRLRRKGVDDAGLRRLLVENPRRAFAFA